MVYRVINYFGTNSHIALIKEPYKNNFCADVPLNTTQTNKQTLRDDAEKLCVILLFERIGLML